MCTCENCTRRVGRQARRRWLQTRLQVGKERSTGSQLQTYQGYKLEVMCFFRTIYTRRPNQREDCWTLGCLCNSRGSRALILLGVVPSSISAYILTTRSYKRMRLNQSLRYGPVRRNTSPAGGYSLLFVSLAYRLQVEHSLVFQFTTERAEDT